MALDPDPDPLDEDPLPLCVADTAQTVIGAPVTIDVIANDSDLNDLQEASAVIFTGPPEDGPLTTFSGGNAAMNGEDTILYTPLPNFLGNDSFSYTAHDTAGQGCVAEVTVTVSGGLADAVAIPSQSRLGLLLLVLLLMVPGIRQLSVLTGERGNSLNH